MTGMHSLTARADGAEAAAAFTDFIGDLGPRIEQAVAWTLDNGPDFSLALAAVIGVFLVLRILRAVVAGLLRRKKRGEYAVANIASRMASETWSVFLLVISIAVVAPFLPVIPEGFGAAARTGAIIIGVIQAAIWAKELLTSSIVGYANREGEVSGVLTNAVGLIKTFVGVGVWIIAALMILSNLNIEITALIAGLGVGGIAIGLAAQNIFKDLFASLSIVFDQPFLRGDFISFDNGDYLGDVQKIGMKTTRLRSLTGEQIIVSNSQLLDKEIRNYRRLDERRSLVKLGVLYSTPHETLEKIPRLIEDAVGAVDKARFERSHLKEYGDSAIIFETVFWVEDREYKTYMDVNHQALMNIHGAFEANRVDFAFPTRTLHVETFPKE